MKQEVDILNDMPAAKKPRKKVVKKFHSLKNVPVEVAVRRQVAEEIGDGEPTKDEKYVLLQKYGATAPRIDRLVTKPNWMGVSEWKRKQNDWLKMTKGLVKPQQRPKFTRTTLTGSMTTVAPFRPRVILDKNGKPLARTPRPWNPQAHHRATSNFRPNSGRGQTGNRPN